MGEEGGGKEEAEEKVENACELVCLGGACEGAEEMKDEGVEAGSRVGEAEDLYDEGEGEKREGKGGINVVREVTVGKGEK